MSTESKDVAVHPHQPPTDDDHHGLEKQESAAQHLTTGGSVTKDLPSLSRETYPAPTAGGNDEGPGNGNGSGDGDGNGNGDAGSATTETETFPEGGMQAWSVVLGSWLALFSALGIMNSIAALHLYIGTNQLADYSDGAVGWTFSVFVFLVFGGGLFVGPYFDKHGARWLLLIGTVCHIASVMLLSVCTQYWHFMLTWILNGIGSSLIFTPSIAAVGHWFQARRGLATGVASSGGSLGGIAFPLAMNALFDRVGFAWAMRIVGLVCLGCCAAANVLIRTRLPPAQNATARPDLRILRDPAFALTTAGVFLLEFSLFIPLTYLATYMISQGFDEDLSYQMLAVLNAGSVLGRVLAGWWGDHFGAFNSNALAVVLSIVACLGVWLPFGGTTPGIVMFALLFGFASGNNISISPVCIGKLCKTENYGRYYATTYTMVAWACLLGIPVAGEVLGANNGQYWGLITMTGLVYVGSFVALAWAKFVCVGWRPLAIF